MNASDFTHLINTDHYSPADLERVNDLCRNYPMFNLAHMLKVRIRESLGYEKEQELTVAAVYAADRRKLFRMVTEVTGEESLSGEPEEILFSSETHPEVDVIIGQHAPYAGTLPADDVLLELDEEAPVIENVESGVVADAKPEEDPELKTGEDSLHSDRLILNFLREDPGPIRADKSTAGRRDVSLASIREHDGFITDTLAQIYVRQGLYAKAIYAYEKLSLKYPEKSAYFAAQIEKISNINHS